MTAKPSKRSARIRLAILAAEYDREIVDAMVRAAEAEAASLGAEVVKSLRVPGTYEIPLPLDRLLGRRDVDAAVVLGYVERGETLHGEVMGHVVHGAIVGSSVAHGKPVGIGVIGPGATREQALARKDEHARQAVRAAIRSLAVVAEIDDVRSTKRPRR